MSLSTHRGQNSVPLIETREVPVREGLDLEIFPVELALLISLCIKVENQVKLTLIILRKIH